MKTGAEAIRALATQLPAFRQKLSDGWYQVRISGRDVSTSGLTAQLHETLPDGAVIHIVPRVAGAKSGGVFQIVLGAAAIAGSFFTAGATLAAWGAAIGAGGMTSILFSLGASMVLGGVAQMLAPKARTPRTQTTDIGAHTHSVAIGSHGHTITVNAAGNAENTVKNIAFNYIVRLA